MRRETDFVLEQAAWPALVLEGNGRICRANQAARRIFDLPVSLPAISVAALWDDESDTTPEQFLHDGIAGGTAPLKLRIAGGAKADFVAHGTNVARDGHSYVVLQLFKESGAAFPEFISGAPANALAPRASHSPEPAKPAGGVWTAVWPVLLVDSRSVICRANPAAERFFGAKSGALFAALCAPEDTAKWSTVLTQNHGELKLRLEMGATATFHLQCCPAEEHGKTLVQFFAAGMNAQAAAPGVGGEEEFLLQDAEWPALVVKKNGAVTRSNRAAVRAFGPLLEKGEQSAAAIWSAQNKGTAAHFLSMPAPDAPVRLTFNLKSGLPGVFMVQMCDLGGDNLCLLQLLKDIAHDPAPPSKPAAAAPVAAPAAGAPAQPAAATAAESLAHKQKLDCALQLARSVALDFNNALTSILGHASLLLSKAEANHPWRNSLSEIEKSASKAAEVANDLAAFSRQEKETRVHLGGNMNTLLERTVEAFQAGLQKPIKISTSIERKLFAANFDEAKMQQAMIKLLDNAVEAIPAGGKISVKTSNLELAEPAPGSASKLPAGNYVCVEVADTGDGIPAEVMPRIFEPFFTTKGSRHRGLGLAWVYGIVTNHGGAVTVNSETGKGASVKIFLPATKKIVRSTPAAATDLSGDQTILFVDDEDLLLTMGQMILSSYGYTVLTANSGQKALEILGGSKKKIDLVITDLVMPNMSGRELSEQILALAPATRIVWSSGYVRSTGEEQERYLQKPFTSQDLLRKVKEALAD